MMVDPTRAIEWLKYDARTNFFVNAIQYTNWECVEGDILEFGVSVGKSLALGGVTPGDGQLCIGPHELVGDQAAKSAITAQDHDSRFRHDVSSS